MRSSLLLAVVFAVAVVPLADAATIRGTARGERLVGTARADAIVPRGGADTVVARAGADRVAVEHDGRRDRVSCGPGRDVVTADRSDLVAADCEVLSVPISTDPYRTAGGQHRTQVEPDSFAHGSTVVAAFQSGRFFDGGAANIGVSTSTDAGRTWTPSFLPGLSVYGSPAGVHPRVSDPVVAYDEAHGTWLVGSLGVSPGLTDLLISRSPDGLRWGTPVVAARTTAPSLAYDKEWLVCDSWPSSPFRGRCYLGYTAVGRGDLVVQSSADGGLTWGAAVRTGPGYFAMPAVQPDGTLVVLHLTGPDERPTLVSAVSRDGGATFAAPAPVADVAPASVDGYRAPPVPSAEVAADGSVFVVWHDARFRSATDVVLSSSLDGVSWSAPVRVPTGPGSAFVPGIGVDPTTGGATTELAIVLYAWARGAGSDAWLVVSRDAGAQWSAPQRLTARTMVPQWIAATNQGTMLADYLSVSWAGGRPVPVFSLASERGAGTASFRQSIASTVRGL